jgi:hypothetical protein
MMICDVEFQPPCPGASWAMSWSVTGVDGCDYSGTETPSVSVVCESGSLSICFTIAGLSADACCDEDDDGDGGTGVGEFEVCLFFPI